MAAVDYSLVGFAAGYYLADYRLVLFVVVVVLFVDFAGVFAQPLYQGFLNLFALLVQQTPVLSQQFLNLYPPAPVHPAGCFVDLVFLFYLLFQC